MSTETRVRSRSFRAASIQVVAAAVGAFSTLFVYPADLELYGIYGFLTNTASLLVPFVSLGFGHVLLRFYPYYRDPTSRHHGFLGLVVAAYGIGLVAFGLLFFLLGSRFMDGGAATDPSITRILPWLLPFTTCLVLYEMASQFSINFGEIPRMAATGLAMKIVLPALFLAAIGGWYATDAFLTFLMVFYLGAVCWLFFTLARRHPLLIGFSRMLWDREHLPEILRYAGFALLGGTSAVLALRIDSFFVGTMAGAEASGKYTLAMFMCNVVFIPATAIADGLNPKVASHSRNSNAEALVALYRTSSDTMLLSTLLLSMGLLLAFPGLADVMPNSEEIMRIRPALVCLILARIVDAATGVNHYLLSYSRYYRFELFLLLGMAVANIALNLLLIPEFGMAGAALATLISVSTYNLIKTLIVYKLLGMHPFRRRTGGIILLALVVFGLFYAIQFPGMHAGIDFVMAGLAGVCFVGMLWALRLSPEFNELMIEQWASIKRRFC
ncbi:MAG: polysaccharide biosynthesis C-terminal domain-containing protein [Saprospiraceae bacterium]|nr:polysaccharide biosynthesis C-terminal domain-containing protein [Saprospiraceae bacterium]MBP9210584.1 polysaccharide biosynthesis C-terminal domain-containing protein [Saprospiraceae bacterium]